MRDTIQGSLLFVVLGMLLVSLSVEADALPQNPLDDVFSSGTNHIGPQYYCSPGWTLSGATCFKDLCDGWIGSYYLGKGLGLSVCTLGGNATNCKCFSGPRDVPFERSCFPSDGGPGGFRTNLVEYGGAWCFVKPGVTMSCPGTFTTKAGRCTVRAAYHENTFLVGKASPA